MTELTKTQVAFIKRINSSVKPYQRRIDALNKKKIELDSKIEENQQWIDKMENAVIEMTGGKTSTEYLTNEAIVNEINNAEVPNNEIAQDSNTPNIIKATPINP